jgi:siroheme synthase-like protein
VGGGQVAERKVEALLEAGAQVIVVSPTITVQLRRWVTEGRLGHVPRAFEDGDLEDALLVFAATDSREVNAAVERAARQERCLVNVADDPAAGDFHTTAAVRQGDLLLAVSTGGASPAVAALVRRKLLTMFGPEYAALLELLGALRPRVSRDVPPAERPHIWRSLATDEVLAWLRAGASERARAYAEELIARVNAAPEV